MPDTPTIFNPERVEVRAAKVASVSGLSTLVSIALQLVTVPVCLHYWGQETYGLWLAVFAIFMLLRTTDNGFVVYTGNQLNLTYHQDETALRQTLGSATWGVAIVGGIQLLLCVLILLSGELARFLNVPETALDKHQAGLALLVLVAGWALTGPYLSIVHRLLVPAGLTYQSTWWAMGFQIVWSGTLAVAAFAQATILETSIAAALVQMAIYVLSALYVKHKIPHLFPWWQCPDWRIAKRDLYRSTAVFGANILQQASANGLVVLASGLLGAAMVPVLTTQRTLTNLWTMAANTLVSPLLPEIVRYHAKQEWRKVVATQHAYWVLSGLVVNLSVLACFPFIDDVFLYWTAGKIRLDMTLFCSLLVAVVLASQNGLVIAYINGINRLRAVMVLALARGLVPVVMSLLLVPVMGLSGIGIALAVGEFFGLLLGYRYLRDELRISDASPSAANLLADVMASVLVVAFLVLTAIGSPHASSAYLIALAGVPISTYWGWVRLDDDVKRRVRVMLDKLTPWSACR